ncbi:MAG: excinuclease ABC subunit UvrC [Gammaproteobacteria bacterium]|nr:excinuclease ABC subunit UvrC [Gammaproteobacteria bacterium]
MSIDKEFLATLPNRPGVYQMLNKHQRVIYVGKAKNLKKRVSSYFRGANDAKTTVLVAQIATIEIIITSSENEALLLENTLIKSLKPKYNILFKDDKSYPYLHLSQHQFPRLSVYRGSKKLPGEYFGPYANAKAARETLHILQKIFKLRQCNDLYFRNRSRPCIQYQIKRCSAPCVDNIDAAAYQESVFLIKKFLQGKSIEVLQAIKSKMQGAAKHLDYEQAGQLRDQYDYLAQVFEQQFVTGKEGDADVIALIEGQGIYAISIVYVRSGKVIGNRNYNLTNQLLTPEEILSDFITQHYLNPLHEKVIPKRILINKQLENRGWIENALSEYFDKKIILADKVRGTNRQWIEMAMTNAQHHLEIIHAKQSDMTKALTELKNIFNLTKVPVSMECFDISHTFGELTVASCVVFDDKGPEKSKYRRYNIKNVKKSDDYAAIRQVLLRRYESGQLPDIVIVDGGKGQMNVAIDVLGKDKVIFTIAKGPTRKPGLEVIYSTTLSEPVELAGDSAALHVLQHIRDEAHRFAITGHRSQRQKAAISSVLETIPGVGVKTRQKLLQHFGGFQEIKAASVEQLSEIEGLNKNLAQRIHTALKQIAKSEAVANTD